MKRKSKKHISKNKQQAKKETKQAVANKQNSNYSILIAIVTSTFVFAISYLFFIPDDITLLRLSLSKNIFVLLTVITSVLIFYIIFKIKEKQTANISKYSFLILLFFSIAASFVLIDKESSKELINLYFKLTAFQTLLIIPTTVLGIISIWIHRAKMQEIVDNLFSEKEKTEEKLSVKDKILKPISNLFSKKERIYTLGLFVVIGISIFTLFYKLDYFDLYSDEGSVTMGAAGYYHSGEYQYFDFVKNKTTNVKYNRAKPHQFLVAQSYKIFGISTWSSRFPSALFGVLLIIFGYFIGKFFIRDKLTVLIVIFSFAFYFEFLLLLRWTRMYSMLFLTYLIATYFAYKLIAENNNFKYSLFKKPFVKKYLNFNYIYLPFLLVLFYLNLHTHQNTASLFPVVIIFSIISGFFIKEKKYFVVFGIGILLLVIQIIFPYKVGFSRFTFFEVNYSEYYSKFIFGYPFSVKTNIIILFTGIFSLFVIKNDDFRKKYLILIITGSIIWLLFSFVFKYSFSFRYISHVIPLVLFFLIGFYILISKTLYNKIIQITLSLLLIVFVLTHFNSRYNDLYVENFAAPTKAKIAYKTIIDNYKKDEIIYQHWGAKFYYSGIDTSAHFLKLWHRNLNTVTNTLKEKSGWIVWSLHNQYAMDKDVVEYCNEYFKKYHGLGIDKTNVEVYYANSNMLVDTNKFKLDKLIPTANLDTKQAYSIAFWVQFSEKNNQTPFYFHNFKDTAFVLNTNNINKTIEVIHKKDNKNILSVNNILDNKLHHVVYYQTGGKQDNKFGVFIDGKKIDEKIFENEIGEKVKLQINRYFTNYFDDIRVYDFVLNKNQINEIIKNKGRKKTETLFVDSKKFKTLYHWQKQ